MSLLTTLLLSLVQLDAPPMQDAPHPWTLTAPLSSSLRALSVQMAPSKPVVEEDAWPDGCGPGPVLVALSSTGLLVGAPLRTPLLTSIAGLRVELMQLQAQRPERSLIELQVDDDVDVDALVAVVDVARGVGLDVTIRGASAERFGLGRWRP